MDEELVQITREKTVDADRLQTALSAMHEHIRQGLALPQFDTSNLSHLVENNIVTPEGTPVPDCRTCGACCIGFVVVPTAPQDSVPDDACWELVTGGPGNELVVDRYIKRRETDYACVHLSGSCGDDLGCRIYEDRPRMCRIFETGSDRCHALRRAFGLEPYLTVEEMYVARKRMEERNDSEREPGDRIENAAIRREDDRRMVVEVFTKGGKATVIHSYDPEKETWYRAQFEGRTIEEASAMVAFGQG